MPRTAKKSQHLCLLIRNLSGYLAEKTLKIRTITNIDQVVSVNNSSSTKHKLNYVNTLPQTLKFFSPVSALGTEVLRSLSAELGAGTVRMADKLSKMISFYRHYSS